MPYIHVIQLPLTLHSLWPKASWKKTILASQLMANFRLLPYLANRFYIRSQTMQQGVGQLKRNSNHHKWETRHTNAPFFFRTQLQTNVRDQASIQQCQYAKGFKPESANVWFRRNTHMPVKWKKNENTSYNIVPNFWYDTCQYFLWQTLTLSFHLHPWWRHAPLKTRLFYLKNKEVKCVTTPLPVM
jgi:hypothetical protein